MITQRLEFTRSLLQEWYSRLAPNDVAPGGFNNPERVRRCCRKRGPVAGFVKFRASRTLIHTVASISLMWVTLALSGCVDETNEVVVTLVDVSGRRSNGDAILVQLQDDTVILIDTGFDRFARSNLIPLLKDRKINRIDDVLITHAHRDHYGGLVALIESGILVNNVYFNLPARVACEGETWTSGCDWEHVTAIRRKLETLGVSVRSAAPGDVIYSNASLATRLEVLFAFDGASTPVGRTDINDTSLIMRLLIGKNSVLLTGDLNSPVGAWLAEQDIDLTATVLKAPHHGVESAAPNEFLEMVDPEIVLVPISTGPWLSERGQRMREFFADRPVFVNGIHGNITVRLTQDDYMVRTQKIR